MLENTNNTNPQKRLKRLVQFVQPTNHLEALFKHAKDTKGNTYWINGLVGINIVLASVKTKKPVGVISTKTGEKEYKVRKWY